MEKLTPNPDAEHLYEKFNIPESRIDRLAEISQELVDESNNWCDLLAGVTNHDELSDHEKILTTFVVTRTQLNRLRQENPLHGMLERIFGSHDEDDEEEVGDIVAVDVEDMSDNGEDD